MKTLASRSVELVLFCFLPFVSARAQAGTDTGAATATVQHISFFSKALGRTMPYEVVLPVQYGATKERYPVLYLLHGWHGDERNYVTLTKITADAAAWKLIVVMPRADDSWYVNSATNATARYADYITNDLPADVDGRFRTIAPPSGRAIAGLSMGGYGALLLSLQHPGLFAFVGSLSGAFDGPSGIEQILPALKPSTQAAFGAQGSVAREKNDVQALIATDDPQRQPYMFLACGNSDALLESNRRIVARLSQRHFQYEYHELPGAHTWSYWDSQLTPMLHALASALHVEPALPLSSVTGPAFDHPEVP